MKTTPMIKASCRYDFSSMKLDCDNIDHKPFCHHRSLRENRANLAYMDMDRDPIRPILHSMSEELQLDSRKSIKYKLSSSSQSLCLLEDCFSVEIAERNKIDGNRRIRYSPLVATHKACYMLHAISNSTG